MDRVSSSCAPVLLFRGLITYRDYAILWDPTINTLVQLQRMAMVIAHELGQSPHPPLHGGYVCVCSELTAPLCAGCSCVCVRVQLTMWTGDIVTASWWSQLWLNEGFARFYQFVAGDAVSPDLMLTDQFITVAQRIALATDSGPNTIPVADDSRNARRE